MNRTLAPHFNPQITLLSGQALSWYLIDGWFYGSFVDKILKLKKDGDHILWQTYPQKDDFEFIHNYFSLDDDYNSAIKDVSGDKIIDEAIKKYYGLTVLNQDFHQTLFSFLLAQNKNIPAIRRSLDFLSKSHGEVIKIDKIIFYLFPPLEFFKDVSYETLRKSGVGYRAKYIKDAAEKFEDLSADLAGISAELNRDSSRSEFNVAKEKLKTIHGVGDKIADCILSFSLGANHITPIDVWGDRIVRDLYGNKKSKTYEQKSRWFTKKFGEHTALAGMFLFEYVRGL